MKKKLTVSDVARISCDRDVDAVTLAMAASQSLIELARHTRTLAGLLMKSMFAVWRCWKFPKDGTAGRRCLF